MYSTSFSVDPDRALRFRSLQGLRFKLLGLYRAVRITRFVTRLLGPQYTPASDLIEIDLTYLCNLSCHNCNRSSAQAPEALHLPVETLQSFVRESLAQQRRWSRIRLLGGEPTLHPEFDRMIATLEPLRAIDPDLTIEVVTNGYGRRVQSALKRLPGHIRVENSNKQGTVQPHFGPFNNAPQDSWWHLLVDYRNGCDIAHTCGMGLTPTGYYPCAVAGGIDRVTGMARGRQNLPRTDDEMRDLMNRACRLCGRFRDGHFVPYKLRPRLLAQTTSLSWQRIYQDWASRRAGLQKQRSCLETAHYGPDRDTPSMVIASDGGAAVTDAANHSSRRTGDRR